MSTAEQFDLQSLFVTDSSPSEHYDDLKFPRLTVHHGQMKLLIADIFFLSLNLDKQKNPVLLTVGAACGQHYPILSKMFPMLKFIMYDPARFVYTQEEINNIAPGKFEIHNDLFTDDIAAKYANRDDIFFTSDIRRGEELNFDKKTRNEINAAIQFDMDMQMRWVKIVNPIHAMLKFRLPYIDSDSGGDFKDIVIDYLDGFIVKQPCAAYRSTETRLFPIRGKDGSWLMRKWSCSLYQDQLHWHNKYARTKHYLNPVTSLPGKFLGDDLADDYDGAAIVAILDLYYLKLTGQKHSLKEITSLFEVIIDDINKWRKLPVIFAQLRATDHKSTSRWGRK